MVYCPKCGTRNEDTAQYCVKCGANLQTGTYESRMHERKRMEHECFGLPHGGAILGLAIGAIILLWGLLTMGYHMGWMPRTPEPWFIILIVVGVLLIAGAVYGMTRSKQSP